MFCSELVHDTQPLADSRVQESSARFPTCSVHPEVELTLFCKVDACLVCVECEGASGRHSGHDLAGVADCPRALHDRLQAAVSRFDFGIEEAQRGEAALAGAAVRATQRLAASLVSLEADAARVKAAIDAHVAQVKAEAEKELKLKLKAMQMQADALAVTANQLSCVRAVCSRLLLADAHPGKAGGDDGVHDPVKSVALANAVATAMSVLPLVKAFTGPDVSSFVDVGSKPQAVVDALQAFAAVRTSVDGSASSVDGVGVSRYRLGADSNNSLEVVARDAVGALLDNILPQDIYVCFGAKSNDADSVAYGDARSVGGSEGDVPVTNQRVLWKSGVAQVEAVQHVGAGCFRVTYSVRGTQPSVAIGVSVCGGGLLSSSPHVAQVCCCRCCALFPVCSPAG